MVKTLINKLRFKHKVSSDEYIKYLRKKGADIGEDVTIYSPRNTIIDEQYPWLIKIGNHVRITEGVVILTHDYSWSVLKRFDVGTETGRILGASGNVNIGNNVFIGMNTLILRNVSIGDNVIIGAGSVVCKDCESDWVYAGNPAKKVVKVEEFYDKRLQAQLSEAKNLAVSYYGRFGKKPPQEIFHEYFMLFTRPISICVEFDKKMALCENYSDTLNVLQKGNSLFANYDEFLKYCFEEE